MKLNEDEQLKNITRDYTKAMQVFAKREYAKALELFDKISEEYKDTEFFDVAEIQTRARVYKNICFSRLNPVVITLQSDEDYINQSVLYLNAGNYDQALELLTELENRKYKDFYLNYLFSIVYLKKGDRETCLRHLKKCIKKDNFYKIIAYNEPDFAELYDFGEFRAIVE